MITPPCEHGWDIPQSRRWTERRVILRDIEVRQSVLPLAVLLQAQGIDPSKPRQQQDLPARAAHLFVQRTLQTLRLSGAERG